MNFPIKSGIFCFSCKKEVELMSDTNISMREECKYCDASLHCCKMCRFYDTASYNECKESNAERVLDKEKANFCDYFSLKSGEGEDAEESVKKLRDAANSLFKT